MESINHFQDNGDRAIGIKINANDDCVSGPIFDNDKKVHKRAFGIDVSKILDTYLPADGEGTEREKLRMNLHREICMLISMLKQ
jgi:hypothetical protein